MAGYIDNFVVEQNLSHETWRVGQTSTATSAGSLTLDIDSTSTQILTGTTAGQVVVLPDATTLQVGWTYYIINDSSQNVAVEDEGSTLLVTIAPGSRALIKCTSISSSAGTWTYSVSGRDFLKLKSGLVSGGTFAGSPVKKATVTFVTPFPSLNYSINITGGDSRIFTYESKAVGSFVISANANQALTQDVHWECMAHGEN
jgi:hypothetical protein